jgi:MYXO-CTERM domain-containing protein
MRGASDRSGRTRAAWLAAAFAALYGAQAPARASGDPAARNTRFSWAEPVAFGPAPARATRRVGDMVVEDASDALPIFDTKPKAALVYLAMEGITLHPQCPVDTHVHSAFDCTSIVEQSTTMPGIGSAAARTAIEQGVRAHFADYDVAFTTVRPEPWVPYLTAVVGDGISLGNEVCGLAHLSCGSARRNVVSVSNTTCQDDAAVVAHEIAHNLGLEHTGHQTDLMHPYLGTGQYFRDACMSISHATGSGTTACGTSHAMHCPSGGGEAQNTKVELMAHVGPAHVDHVAPVISEVTPVDGAVFGEDDVFEVSATVVDDGGFVAVRWRLVEAPDLDDEVRRCTNDACEAGFDEATIASGHFPFVIVHAPPIGDYTFVLEAVDAHGNRTEQWIRVTVASPFEEEDDEEPEEDDEEPEEDDELAFEPDPTTDPEALPDGYGTSLDDLEGCSCRSTRSPPALLLPLLAVVARRRRPSGSA